MLSDEKITEISKRWLTYHSCGIDQDECDLLQEDLSLLLQDREELKAEILRVGCEEQMLLGGYKALSAAKEEAYIEIVEELKSNLNDIKRDKEFLLQQLRAENMTEAEQKALKKIIIKCKDCEELKQQLTEARAVIKFYSNIPRDHQPDPNFIDINFQLSQKAREYLNKYPEGI